MGQTGKSLTGATTLVSNNEVLTCIYRDPLDGTAIRVLDASEDEIMTVAITSEGEYFVSAGADKLVKVWHYDEGVHHSILDLRFMTNCWQVCATTLVWVTRELYHGVPFHQTKAYVFLLDMKEQFAFGQWVSRQRSRAHSCLGCRKIDGVVLSRACNTSQI